MKYAPPRLGGAMAEPEPIREMTKPEPEIGIGLCPTCIHATSCAVVLAIRAIGRPIAVGACALHEPEPQLEPDEGAADADE